MVAFAAVSCALLALTGGNRLGAPRRGDRLGAPRSAALRRSSVALAAAVPSAGLVLGPSRTPSFDDMIVGSACVRRFVYDDSENWMMWYSARGKEFSDDVLPIATGQIGLATSDDGITWKREGAVLTENREEWYFFDTSHVGVGDVQIMSSQAQRTGGVGMYWCYYFGGDMSVKTEGGPKGSSMSIGLAMSSNGRNWGRMEGEHSNGAILTPSADSAQFDSAFVGWPQVVMRAKEDYLLFYHTIDEASGEYVVAAAQGKDGVKFEKIGKVLTAGPAGSFDARGAAARHVIEPKAEGQPRYLMLYEAVDGAGVHAIGLARSADGVKWEKQAGGPVFSPSAEPGAWDGGAVGRPNLVALDDGRYRLYYYGQSGKGAGAAQEWAGIGIAECDGSDLSSWERVNTTGSDPFA